MKSNAQNVITPVDSNKEPIELAFGVVRGKDKLYSVKMIKYQGDKILDVRISNGTTMGHALADAEDMLSHFNLFKAESNVSDPFAFKAESYFKEARMI